MQQYSYDGVDGLGNPVTGNVEAGSLDEANGVIAARGHIASNIRPTGRAASAGRKSRLFDRRVKALDLVIFTKQLSTMLRAGVPMLRGLEILKSQSENGVLARTAQELATSINEGASLHAALGEHPKLFSPLYRSMVRAGESSGSLPEVLDRLLYILRHEEKVKADIRSAFQYPILVVVCLSVAFVVLLTYVVPKFGSVFRQAGVNLPWPTRVCLDINTFLSSYGTWFFGGVAVAVLLAGAYFRTSNGRYVLDAALMKLPAVGGLLQKAAISRFASICAILQAAGVGILDSLDILMGTINNSAISRDFAGVREQLKEGRGIAKPLMSAKHLTPMLINMVAIGEEAGNLDEMLREVADHYDIEVEYATKRLADLVGPVLIIALAAVVGFFALAIYLPMWDLAGLAMDGG